VGRSDAGRGDRCTEVPQMQQALPEWYERYSSAREDRAAKFRILAW
jgi:hypothetical protein